MPLTPIHELIEAFRQGEMVIMVDDEHRENEGDILFPAPLIEAHHINFMATHARGLICLTLTAKQCAQLRLPMMVSKDQDTNFTVSIEAARGVSTGISANDRAHTIRTAVAANAMPADITMPGHIFPLRAQDGGVLVRAGHTEAGCDLARLAGFEVPSAVIVEIMNPDGTMARLPDLITFAETHNIKLGAIADLIRYRLQKDTLVKRTKVETITTRWGDIECAFYEETLSGTAHYVLRFGADIGTANHTAHVRVQAQNPPYDTLGTPHGWHMDAAIAYLQNAPCGRLVVLGSGKVQEKNLRTFGIGAQILAAEGVKTMHILGTSADYSSIRGFGLNIGEFIAPDATPA